MRSSSVHLLPFLAVAGLFSMSVFARVSDLSAACSESISALSKNPQFQSCVPLNSKRSNVTTPEQTLAEIENFVNLTCSQPKCSLDDITKLVADIKAGCSTEIKAGVATPTIITIGFEMYPAIYDTVCLKESDGDYCIVEIYKDFFEDVYNNNNNNTATTDPEITSIVPNLNDTIVAMGLKGTSAKAINSFFSKEICKPCMQKSINILIGYPEANPTAVTSINSTILNTVATQLNSTLSSICGFNYLNETGLATTTTTMTAAATMTTTTSTSSLMVTISEAVRIKDNRAMLMALGVWAMVALFGNIF